MRCQFSVKDHLTTKSVISLITPALSWGPGRVGILGCGAKVYFGLFWSRYTSPNSVPSTAGVTPTACCLLGACLQFSVIAIIIALSHFARAGGTAPTGCHCGTLELLRT